LAFEVYLNFLIDGVELFLLQALFYNYYA